MTSLKTKLLWVLIGALAVSAVTGLYALVLPSSGSRRWDLFQSAMSLVSYTLGWMACTKVGAQRRLRWRLAIPATLLLALGYAGVLVLVWVEWSATSASWLTEDTVGKLTTSVTTLGVTLVGAGLLGLIKAQRSATNIIRWATIALGTGLVVMLLLIFWEVLNVDDPNAIVSRVFFSLLILTSVGVVGSIVLRRIEVGTRSNVAETRLLRCIQVSLTCPKCDLVQDMPTGGAACKRCGLSITVEVAAPVCVACGHSLADLHGVVCPECGVEIPADVLRLVRKRGAEE